MYHFKLRLCLLGVMANICACGGASPPAVPGESPSGATGKDVVKAAIPDSIPDKVSSGDIKRSDVKAHGVDWVESPIISSSFGDNRSAGKQVPVELLGTMLARGSSVREPFATMFGMESGLYGTLTASIEGNVRAVSFFVGYIDSTQIYVHLSCKLPAPGHKNWSVYVLADEEQTRLMEQWIREQWPD